MADPIEIRTASLTDVGRRRSHNEDAHAIVTREVEGGQPPCTLIVVADGMGGTNAGEVASQLTVETVVRVFFERIGEGVREALLRAFDTSNTEVFTQSSLHPEWASMATTCTAVVVIGRRMWFAHVGDSRIYLLRDGRATRITRDHSLVAELVEQHRISEEAARSHARRNVVTRGIGVEATVDVDLGDLDGGLVVGDRVLVCTDGLHGMMSDEEIAQRVDGTALEEGCRRLVELANERGGPDNITVVMAGLDPPAPADHEAAARREPVPRHVGTIGLWIAFLVLLAAVIAIAARMVLRVLPAGS